jgi:hypothetical protein
MSGPITAAKAAPLSIPNVATLEQRPERIEVGSMYFAAYIVALTMANGFMRIAEGSQVVIAAVFIGCDQINLVTDYLANESIEGGRVSILDHLADHVTLAAIAPITGVLPVVLPRTPLRLLRCLFRSLPQSMFHRLRQYP